MDFRLLVYLGICAAIFGCRTKSSSSDLNELNQAVANEEFMTFFSKWCSDEDFQRSRIQFPLNTRKLDENFNIVSSSLRKEEWKPYHCYYDNQTDSRSQFYDSFDHRLRDTDERVFAWHGIGTNEQIFYYFKRIRGRWYLVQYEDIGT